MNQLDAITKHLEKNTREKIKELSKTERTFTEWYTFRNAIIETNIEEIYNRINIINKTIKIINKILIMLTMATLFIGLSIIINTLKRIL